MNALTPTQEQLAPEVTPAPAATPEPLSHFDQEMADAMALLEAEKTGAPPPEPIQAPAAAPAATPAPAPAAAPPEQVMIPKARFDEVLAELRNTQNHIAYLEGQIDARPPAPAQPAPAAAPAPAPAPAARSREQMLDDLNAKRVEIAEQYEKGDITSVEMQKQIGLIDKEVLLELTKAPAPAAQPAFDAQQAMEELATENVKRELEATNPWLYVIDDKQFSIFEAQASLHLAAKGFSPQTPGYAAAKLQIASNMLAQQAPAILGITPEQADAHARRVSAGGAYRGKAAPAAGGPPAGGQPTAQPPPKAPLSPQAAARAGKLDLASRMPPNITGAPSGAGPAPLTDAQLFAMTEDQIMALPETTRRAIMPT